MTQAGRPEPFHEIERARAAFEVFETASAQIGSGRPSGPRSQLWGSVVVLARTSLEEALRRLHYQLCEKPDCADPQLDPGKLRRFLTDHSLRIVEQIPLGLHVAMREKAVAKSGVGSGVAVNGPLDSERVFDLLGALNHTRNGFVHQDPKKTERLHGHGEGVLWVRPDSGSVWTVQKPHAFSTMRFCHVVFRFVVLCAWGEEVAMDVRSELPVLLEDRLLEVDHRIDEELARLVSAVDTGDLAKALSVSRRFDSAVLRTHFHGDEAQLTLGEPSQWVSRPLSDPLS